LRLFSKLFVLSGLLLAAGHTFPAQAQTQQTYIAAMNGGGEHNIMLKPDGTVWAWGWNDSGQVGNGTTTDTYVPYHVPLPPIKAVAAGQHYTIALTQDGLCVYAFGDNRNGTLGIGKSKTAYSAIPVQVKLPTLPQGVTITAIADGGRHAAALLSNGQVLEWGKNQFGQAGQDPKVYPIVYLPMYVTSISNVKMLAGSDHTTLALKTDGTVWAWGCNRYGQLGPVPTPSRGAFNFMPTMIQGLPTNVTMIATGGEHHLVLAGGIVYGWGRNTFGQLGNGTIDKTDGPHPTVTAASPSIMNNILWIKGEGPFTLAADSSGQIWAFGANRNGEVGNGKRTDTGTPQNVLSIPFETTLAHGPSVRVSAGHFFSYAFNLVTGQTFAWGKNAHGELTEPPSTAPVTSPIDVTLPVLGQCPMVLTESRSQKN
jgi:alpha-tubulin suppressor-like RCC1 family protein